MTVDGVDGMADVRQQLEVSAAGVTCPLALPGRRCSSGRLGLGVVVFATPLEQRPPAVPCALLDAGLAGWHAQSRISAKLPHGVFHHADGAAPRPDMESAPRCWCRSWRCSQMCLAACGMQVCGDSFPDRASKPNKVKRWRGLPVQ